MRNRIIAGLVDAVVVIESKANGGSLITAELANDYNREVFAFPGPIHHPQSEGCHALIRKQQAHLLSSAKELLEIMNWTNTSQGNKLNQHHDLTALQKEMLDQFKNKNNWSIDELAFSTQKAVSIISSTLFELEMQGSIQNIGANRYRLPL
jgi:DNA processing protein